MSRVTGTLTASADLDGTSAETTKMSFSVALERLQANAKAEGRVVLFDTLNITMERNTAERSTLVGEKTIEEYTFIVVSAQATKLPTSAE